ncbi:MAG: Smr/MutS family protein, partial [Firmicutes bacterium]|nr:Smr/MutS family protein [Bacillota bacterium]
IVSLNNKIKELRSEEKLEIKKILTNLSRMVEENRDILQTDLNVLSHIDFIFAKGELSLSMNGTEPKFNKNGHLNIKKARHPLLDPKAVVATDIYLGDEFTTLLITGPNTGGKTVALKTIGLFTLMGQSGLHISAFDNSELCVFDDVFSDIGDEQSIEQSLSTFSSHMSNIVKILENVTDNSLVLMDELGAGTDPTEGAALATAIIGYLHDREIRTVVTTHYSELKVYALSTDGIENASCEFDVETLRPTYKLLIGVPGKSNAFAISSRLGLPDFIINDAKELLSHEDKRFEDVITDLEISRKNLITEQERAEEYRLEAQRLKKDVEERKRKTREQRDKILKEANETARKIISDAKDESDSIIKQMQKMLRDNTPLHELDEMRQKLNTKLKDSDEKLQKLDKKKKTQKYETPVPSEIKKGDRIYVHSLEQSGYVETLPNSKNELMVRVGALNMKVNIKDISMDRTKIKEEKQKNPYSVKTSGIKAQHVSAEVDLRGLMVYEAIEKLDKYLDDAYLSHLTPVTVIHGKGTGALRSAVTDFLRKNRHVKSFRLGQYGEG